MSPGGRRSSSAASLASRQTTTSACLALRRPSLSLAHLHHHARLALFPPEDDHRAHRPPGPPSAVSRRRRRPLPRPLARSARSSILSTASQWERNARVPSPLQALADAARPTPHPPSLPALIATYGRTLTALKHLPESFTYRQGTEALTRSRLTAVERVLGGSAWESASESQQDAWVKEVERELGNDGAVQVEEMIDMARGEEQLVAKMIEWKA